MSTTSEYVYLEKCSSVEIMHINKGVCCVSSADVLNVLEGSFFFVKEGFDVLCFFLSLSVTFCANWM